MILNAAAHAGEIAWTPTEGVAENLQRFGEMLAAAGLIDATDYDTVWAWSVRNTARFWEEFAAFAGVRMGGTRGDTISGDQMPDIVWFSGRTVNFAEHLLRDRQGVAVITIDEDGHRTEHRWEQVREHVASLAGTLRTWGIVPGDRIAAVLPNVYEAFVGFLATAAIGAVWSICAPEFGKGAVVSRFAQLEPRVLLASNGYRHGGKDRDRSEEIASIIESLPTLERVVWVTGIAGPNPPIAPASTAWSEVISTTPPIAPRFEQVEFSHPLWVLFSSGTTGVPKGIVHGHGGILLEMLKMLLLQSELRPGDRYLNIASTSWVLWNTLVSAVAVGAVPVLVDGSPTFPALDRMWQIAREESVAVIGVSAGFIHACRKADLDLRGSLPTLRTIQVTGSPLSEDGFRWILDRVGDVWVSSMSGGTDIGSVFVAGSPSLPVRIGRIPARALGVDAQAWSADGRSLTGEPGELVIISPMPSMPLYFWGDEDGSRYRDAYFGPFPGVWCHGDLIEFDGDGSSVILGRSDATLNRHGLRLGPADIYRVVEDLPQVVEALVVGAELGDEDYFMPLFVHLAPGVSEGSAAGAIQTAIRAELSARYLPDAIVVMAAIPHTRTGKKLEVPVKRLLQGSALEAVVSPGAVDDYALLEQYAHYAERRESGS